MSIRDFSWVPQCAVHLTCLSAACLNTRTFYVACVRRSENRWYCRWWGTRPVLRSGVAEGGLVPESRAFSENLSLSWCTYNRSGPANDHICCFFAVSPTICPCQNLASWFLTTVPQQHLVRPYDISQCLQGMVAVVLLRFADDPRRCHQ